jgi:hypothetical protein
VLVFGMIMTVVYGYFLLVNQSEQSFLKTVLQGNASSLQQQRESLTVTGTLIGPAIGFLVNNTGITATITSTILSYSSNGLVIQYNTGNSTTPSLPYLLNGGQSAIFNTGILYTKGQSYTIKILTARGSTFVGTYPPQQLSVVAVSALVAAGLGSISMIFNQYSFYGYSSTKGSYVIDISHPHSGAILPFQSPAIALSLQITNNDPGLGTITLDSHTDLFIYETCPQGCGGNVPLFAFYLVNVANNGTITSINKGSFVPIQVPYGRTVTLYFASQYDLSQAGFATECICAIGQKASTGEYDVFMILSGTDTGAQSLSLYSQNLPFAASYVSNDIGWFSETPVTCVHGAITNFTLTVVDSQYSQDDIVQVSINASSFSSLSAIPQSPWKLSISSGVITWSNGNLDPSKVMSFSWGGRTPPVVGNQLVLPLTITWSNGFVQQSAVGCYTT